MLDLAKPPSPSFAGYSPDFAEERMGCPPPPASPGTPPTSRLDFAGERMGSPLPRLRRVLPRLRGGENERLVILPTPPHLLHTVLTSLSHDEGNRINFIKEHLK